MAAADLSQVYVEGLTNPAAPVSALSQIYIEVATKPATTPRNLSQVYLEVLVPARRPFIGWGVPA